MNALVAKDAIPHHHHHVRLQTSVTVVMHGCEQPQQSLQTWRSLKGALTTQQGHKNHTRSSSQHLYQPMKKWMQIWLGQPMCLTENKDCRKEDCVKHIVLSRCWREYKLMPSLYCLDSCIAQNHTSKCTSGFTTQKYLLCLTRSATNSGLPCAGDAGSSAAEAASGFKRVACKAVKVFGCMTGVMVEMCTAAVTWGSCIHA